MDDGLPEGAEALLAPLDLSTDTFFPDSHVGEFALSETIVTFKI